MSRTLVVCALFVCIAFAHKFPGPLDNHGVPKIPCFTQEAFEMRYPDRADCSSRGNCDNATYRATHGDYTDLTVNLVVHIMNSATGDSPDGVTESVATSMMERVVESYGSYGITLEYELQVHNDQSYYCIPGYSTSGEFLDAIESMKEIYAVDPKEKMNIFISCMKFSFQGTLYGIATFPWDNIALTKTGGLWLNSIACNTAAQLSGDATCEHELGHCLGLWHTFHGTDEVLGCNLACEEFPHTTIDPDANTVGDFCADTPATPRNYTCANPGGLACNGSPWGNIDYTNYMGYGMEPTPCGNHFTDQQKARMQCWTCDALSTLTNGCSLRGPDF